MHKPNPDPFLDVVERELKNRATESEKAWLRSEENLLRWEDALALLLTQTQGNLAHLNQRELEEKQRFLAQGSDGKAAWFQRKAEIGKKKTAAKFFTNIVSTKRFEVKQLRAQAKAKPAVAVSLPAQVSDTELMFPSAVGELLDVLLHSKKPKLHTDLFLAAFVVRVIRLYDEYGPNEEEILDKITRVEPERIMDFWHPEELD